METGGLGAVGLHSMENITDFLMAVTEGDIGKVQRYISQGMNVNVTDLQTTKGYPHKMTGDSALHKAAEFGHIPILEALCAAKPPPNINAVNQKNQTALHKACISNQKKSCQFLINHGADTCSKTKLGWEPWHIACSNGFINIVQVLYNAKVDIHTHTEEGETGLLLACISRHTDIIEFLLPKTQASINYTDKSGRSALHISVAHTDEAIVKMLLKHGADRHLKNRNGESPLDLAKRLPERLIQKLIEDDMPDVTDAACNMSDQEIPIVNRSGDDVNRYIRTINENTEKLEEMIDLNPSENGEKRANSTQVDKNLDSIHIDLKKMTDLIFTEESTKNGETVKMAKLYKELHDRVTAIEQKLNKNHSLLKEPKCSFLKGRDEIFVEHMLVDDVMHCMKKYNILDYRESEKVEAESTRHERVKALLNLLSKKTNIEQVKDALIEGLMFAQQEYLAVLIQ